MTEQPTRDQIRALADKATEGPWSYPGELLGLPCSTVFAGDPKRTHAAYVAAMGPDDGAFIAAARTAVPHLLGQLDQAEHRIARLEAQSAIRGRAVVMYRERARDAETRIRDLTQEVKDERGAALDLIEQVKIRDARIKAVQHLIDQADEAGDWTITATAIQRAIDGEVA